MNFSQNNLKDATSPYLQQHRDNPIWWQSWNSQVIDYAQRSHKIIFVSIGYATCHWCHVMAQEAFSHLEIADYLNQHFVAIKVDREQRPDIDRFLLNFITAMGGQGGWPLNAFLTPELKPIFALTYAGVSPRFGQPGFLEILRQVKKFYDEDKQSLTFFSPPQFETGECSMNELLEVIWGAFDKESGGFGNAMKFPPHATLLFLLYHYAADPQKKIKLILKDTLDAMLWGGLHDHLQGGFFRYCVDRQWRIPHFEKMLYDQALLLWIYSLAFKIFQEEAYKTAAEKILTCLEETFAHGNLFSSAHDADTQHQEGVTYLWKEQELRSALTPEEYQSFAAVYVISPEGNLDGKNHLFKKKKVFLNEIEGKLLRLRNLRPQPFLDKKIVTVGNSLAGLGLIHAYRFLGREEARDKAVRLFETLMAKHFRENRLAHSSLEGVLQPEEFLQDVAALLLLATYLYEETGRFDDEMMRLYQHLKIFQREGIWVESFHEDFIPVLADPFDLPIPSSLSLAELALLRVDILKGKEYFARKYQGPLNSDFLNIASLLANGLFHIVTAPHTLDWQQLPAATIQTKGDRFVDCYKGVCQESPAAFSKAMA